MKHPPYHLRTNKAVDRLLLVDVLRPMLPDAGWTYYSLAGPFLEDLRVMDHHFPEMRLVSLEKDDQTFARQKFHKFNARIELINKPLREYVTNDYEPGERDVFWLDYTDLTLGNLEQFQVILTSVPNGSVIRITLRADPDVDIADLSGKLADEEIDRLKDKLQAQFELRFKEVLPNPVPAATGDRREFAYTVQLMVQQAASKALDTSGSTRTFLPVQCTRYDDNTQMLSVTGVVCARAAETQMKTVLQNVRFRNFDWSPPSHIQIPALSLKECFKLEEYLPTATGVDSGENLSGVLNYRIDYTDKGTKKQLSQYADHHREYPRFVRLTV